MSPDSIDDLLSRPHHEAMDQARWQAVNRIFHDALAVAPAQRHAFACSAAAGDSAILAEVEALLQADAAAGDYLESPLSLDTFQELSGPPLKAGDLLCERFSIVRPLAEGGMGHVFEALDTELFVPVAVKLIRPEIASVPEARSRFYQEVRLARTITHPNVCRTFDINRDTRILAPSGDKTEILFLTMELLHGETLAARIAHTGALPLDEAYQLAHQIADALTAAHALGIIHRDIKPSNIMLVPGLGPTPPLPRPSGSTHQSLPCELRAVVTDFGLARVDPTLLSAEASSFSPSGRPIGTLAYMAPEQLKGEPVSPATDIYAFGLLLFEMVTGRRAFDSENLFTDLSQRLSGPPPLPSEHLPDLPAAWCRAIDCCLQISPADRVQSPRSAVALLTGRHRSQALLRRSANVFRPAVLPRIRLAVVVILVAMSLSLAAYRLYRSNAPLPVTAGALVYLAPVDNRTGERSLDNLGTLLQAGLAQSAQINLLDQARIGDILQQMTRSPQTSIDPPTAREIAMRAGAVRVIFVTASSSGATGTLEVDIQQPDTSARIFRQHQVHTFSWTANQNLSQSAASANLPPQLLSSIREASDWIRSAVGESKNDLARLDLPPENVTTADWQALLEYDQAQKALAYGRKDEAITLLRSAIKRDPAFARAYADLADNLASLGRTDEAYQDYLKALDDDSGQRLSRKERDFIKGAFATDTRDYQSAVEAFRDSSAFYEHDFTSWFYQGYPLNKLNRPLDAIEVLKRADALSPSHHGLGEMLFSYLLLGDTTSARSNLEDMRRAGNVDQANMFAGIEAFCEGNYAEAARFFTLLQRSANRELALVGMFDEVRLLAEQGNFAQAIERNEAMREAVAGSDSSEDKAQILLDRAYLAFQTADSITAFAHLSQAIELNHQPNILLMASTITGEAVPHLSATDRRQAERLLSRMEALLPRHNPALIFELAQAQIHGELLLAGGDTQGALVSLRRADQLDAPVGSREYLARALSAAASAENNPAKALAMRNEALALYREVISRPIEVWIDAHHLPPGLVADQMSAYLKLARVLNDPDRGGSHSTFKLTKQDRNHDQANSDILRVSAALVKLRGKTS